MAKQLGTNERLPGWLFSAARAATSLGFRELAEQASVGNVFLLKLEKLAVVEVREGPGRGITGVDAEPLARVLALYRKHGLELRPAGAGWPAALLAVDPVALDRVRASQGKGAD